MTGPMLAERLRAGMPGLKVLLVSGYRADLPAMGAPFLSKPFTAPGLARRVRSVLDGE